MAHVYDKKGTKVQDVLCDILWHLEFFADPGKLRT